MAIENVRFPLKLFVFFQTPHRMLCFLFRFPHPNMDHRWIAQGLDTGQRGKLSVPGTAMPPKQGFANCEQLVVQAR